LNNFIGLTYNGRHTSEFNIFRVSGSSFYTDSLFGEISDNVKSVIGRDGAYYINSLYGPKSFSLEFGMTEKQYMDLKAWLKPSSTFSPLIYDETPYKMAYVKVTSNPTFNFIPSSDSTNNYVYNGTMSVNFLQVDPYSYAVEQSVSSYESKGEYENIWKENSNILLTAQTPSVSLTGITTAQHYLIFNAGNVEIKPNVTISGTGSNIIVAREVAEGTYEGNSISSISNETIIVENGNGQIVLNGTPNTLVTFRKNSTHKWLSFEPTITVDRFDSATFSIEAENGYRLTLPTGNSWPWNAVGKHVCINNCWYKISERVSDTQINLESIDGYANYTNLITNGNFANGTTGWFTTSSTISALAGILSVTGNGTNSTVGAVHNTAVVLDVTHKYYLRARMRVTNNVSTNLRLIFDGVDSGTDLIIGSVANPIQNQWYVMSAVSLPPANATGNLRIQLWHQYADASTANGKVMEVDGAYGILCVDLTEAFGAGNEPTKEQFEAMLAYQTTRYLKNLVTNGNFASGTTGWTGIDAVVAGVAEKTNTAQYQSISHSISNPTSLRGNKIYATAMVKADSNQVCLLISDAISLVQKVHTGNNSFQRLSVVKQIENTATAVYPRVQDNRASGFTKYYAYNFLSLDLTTIFGYGNEPTAAEMDAIIDSLGGWWDGEKEYGTETALLWWDGSLGLLETTYNNLVVAKMNDVYVTGDAGFNIDVSFDFKHKYI
jgi:hypothetical protein